ncbi:MAG: DUF2236 domain-containing protein [Acidobacteriaceae bacterium]|nr:DUF2236 domain-containing protein [Acidobacteriaceae bacterium]
MSIEVVFQNHTHRLRFRFRPLRVPVSDDGLFARGSIIRRVYADAALNFGAGRALLLQIAHPSLAAAVSDHSDFECRPLDRLFATLYALTVVIYGSRSDAARIGAAVERVHERIIGLNYHALDPELLCWVNATLSRTAIDLYQLLIGPLSTAELDEFVAEARKVGAVFGCPIEAQPRTWPEFCAYWDGMVASLAVSDAARRICRSVLRGVGLPLRPLWLPLVVVNGAVAAALLPERLRREFELPWRRRERAIARLALGATAAILPRMPEGWRQLGPELLLSPRSASN